MAIGRILSLATLFLNSNIFNDFERYKPKHVKTANFYFYNDITFNKNPELVDIDREFPDALMFQKCCPPGFLYEPENRDCVEAKNVSEIYEDIEISLNLVKYGLFGCPVIIDRFINKNNLRRSDGNGSLVIDGETFRKDRFCIDKITKSSDNYVIRLCHEPDYCLKGTGNSLRDWCIPRCCGDTFGVIDDQCRQMPRTGLHVKKNKNFFESVDGYGFLYNNELTCNLANWKDFHELSFTMKTTGSLFKNDDSREYKVGDYCLETRYNTKSQSYTNLIIICDVSLGRHTKFDLVKVAIILTCGCFVATISVYIFVYKLKKLVEKIVACVCTVGLMFWILYAMKIFYTDFKGFCTLFGYIFFFIMLSRLTWLNVLSYEIWHTLGKTRAIIKEPSHILWKKFVYYCTYAIGVPLLCTLFFILGDQEMYSLPNTIKPYIDPIRCSIYTTKIGNYGHYLHLHLPISILVIINIVLYVKTILYVLEIKNDIRKISRTNTYINHRNAKTNSRNQFIVLKLGLIMGITWIYYIFYYLTDFQNILILEMVGQVLFFSNLLEGVYFLIIFVFKWRYISRIPRRLRKEVRSTWTRSVRLSTEYVAAMPMERAPQ